MSKPKIPVDLAEISQRDRDALMREQQLEIRRNQNAAFHRKKKQKRGRSRKRGSYDD